MSTGREDPENSNLRVTHFSVFSQRNENAFRAAKTGFESPLKQAGSAHSAQGRK